MPDAAQAWFERARAATDGGHPEPGPMAGWEVFPFEGDLAVKPLGEREVPEPDRRKSEADCKVCKALADERLLLAEGQHLTVIRTGGTSLMFTANVVSKAHAPLDDLDPAAYAELGTWIGRTYTALKGLPGVGNVHVNKWENGTGHLAVVLLARPEGVLNLRGSNLPIWADMLPGIPEEEYAERAGLVRAALA